jgi:hypothetical protein
VKIYCVNLKKTTEGRLKNAYVRKLKTNASRMKLAWSAMPNLTLAGRKRPSKNLLKFKLEKSGKQSERQRR